MNSASCTTADAALGSSYNACKDAANLSTCLCTSTIRAQVINLASMCDPLTAFTNNWANLISPVCPESTPCRPDTTFCNLPSMRCSIGHTALIRAAGVCGFAEVGPWPTATAAQLACLCPQSNVQLLSLFGQECGSGDMLGSVVMQYDAICQGVAATQTSAPVASVRATGSAETQTATRVTPSSSATTLKSGGTPLGLAGCSLTLVTVVGMLMV
ncbi:hypothetical protein BJ741DRAFT_579334 [Chytriomyces cf. hyalinus JEL632]|nr:hypothetical protein BJ741DRAFT_579334 [Chytriomyces cf. hyalinus JEL632]